MILGVGEKTAKTLKAVGIKKVEDLIVEETSWITEKAGLSESIAAKIRGTARLLMIPGMKLETVRYLLRVGISSVEELAKQSPPALYRKISVVAKGKKDKPCFEDLALSVRLARFYVFESADTPKFYFSPLIEETSKS